MAEPTKYKRNSTDDLPMPCDKSDDAASDAGKETGKAEIADTGGGTENSPDPAPDDSAKTTASPDPSPDDSAITTASSADKSDVKREDETKEIEESCWAKIMPCCICGHGSDAAPDEEDNNGEDKNNDATKTIERTETEDTPGEILDNICGSCKKKEIPKAPKNKEPSKSSKCSCLRWCQTKTVPVMKQLNVAKDKAVGTVKTAVPVIMALVGLLLMGFDQFSDIKTGYSICNVQCNCLWSIKPNGTEQCEVPGSAQEEEKPCYATFGNKEMIDNYCQNGPNGTQNNRTSCLALDAWEPNATRHPKFCASSITTILGPNIINSTYCLISLWYLYETVFKFLRSNSPPDPDSETPEVIIYPFLSNESCLFKYFRLILLVLWPLQILPYVWMVMHVVICVKLWKCYRGKEIRQVGLKKWEESSKTSKLIFTTLEDTPQLLLHSTFIINSAITEEHSLVDQGLALLTPMTCLSLASSSASIAFSLTVFKDKEFHLQIGGKLIGMLPSLISVGTRALVCACYAASVVEDYDLQTWTLFLPPSIACGIAMLENLPHVVNKIISLKHPENRKHISSPRDIITQDRIMNVLSFLFEANSIVSISGSFTYLTFAVALHTVWTSEFTSRKTRLVFIIIQYLALLSVIINMLFVQLEEWNKWRKDNKVRWRGKILCFLYSLIFLLGCIGLYKWLHHPTYFDYYKKMYFPNIDPKTKQIKKYLSFAEVFKEAETNEDVDLPLWIHLANIEIILYTAGVFVFVNLIMIIISFKQYRNDPPVISSQENIEMQVSCQKCKKMFLRSDSTDIEEKENISPEMVSEAETQMV